MVLMQSKSTEAYQAVLERLKELGLNVSKAITDWEASERLAWRQAFPEMIVLGCVWHFIRVSFSHVTKISTIKNLLRRQGKYCCDG